MMRTILFRSRGIRVTAAAGALTFGACGGDRVSAPTGSASFSRFEVIGGAVASGVASDGLVSTTQATAWPALLANAADVPLRRALHRSPGCAPPLVAPLLLGRRLSGVPTTEVDSSCAGTTEAFTPPGTSLAIGGATAWDAVNATPRTVAAAPTLYDAPARGRYAATLAPTQSQVTATLVAAPTLVAVELGLAEVARAAVSGRVVAATAYGEPAGWTFAPPALFAPAFDAVADSLEKSGARVVVLGVPPVTQMPAFRTGSVVWDARAELATFGVNVAADCQGSTNLIHVATVVVSAAVRAVAAGTPQAASCADTPGADDGVLTAAEVVTLASAVTQMNAHLADVASAHGWAFADGADAWHAIVTAAPPFSAHTLFTCHAPFGRYLSLDGLHPSATGQQVIAGAVAAALNAKYGFAIPVADPAEAGAECDPA
jgi:hypothetical protein